MTLLTIQQVVTRLHHSTGLKGQDLRDWIRVGLLVPDSGGKSPRFDQDRLDEIRQLKLTAPPIEPPRPKPTPSELARWLEAGDRSRLVTMP